MAHVLIVEDENVLRLTFGQFLEEEGHTVDRASNYDEAVERLERRTPDAIVTDIILGGKTGIDLLRTIQSKGAECPVIMITGDPSVNTASEAVRLGAFDYLAKPVTRPILLKVVRLALEHKKVAEQRNAFATKSDQYRRELETIFNSVSEGIVTVNERARVRHINEAALRMFELKSDPREKSLDEALPASLSRAREALRQTLDTRKGISDIRIETPGKGLGRRVLIINTRPLVGAHGSFEGAVLVARDITRLTDLEKQVEERNQYRRMVGKSPQMREIFQLIDDMADTDSTVLICGESGTGKELVAEALHHTSGRAKGPFVRVNCAALSEDLLESELFGHVKGAFTGALKDRVGRFELANGGTILLDEIGDISPRLQLRLLRVLQEREFERVGDSRPIRVDVRVVAATNQDLLKKIEAGEFRQDLYFRLNVVRIEVPPLRERKEDIPLLCEHFCKHFNKVMKKEVTGVSPEAMEILLNYPWPGNIRELENCLERAFVVCRENTIQPRHLPVEITHRNQAGAMAADWSAGNGQPESERERVLQVLRATDWNVAKSARKLGVARNTLYQKIRTYGLSRPNS